MKEAEERVAELDDVGEPTDAELDAIDDETVDRIMEELSIDVLLEEILYG